MTVSPQPVLLHVLDVQLFAPLAQDLLLLLPLRLPLGSSLSLPDGDKTPAFAGVLLKVGVVRGAKHHLVPSEAQVGQDQLLAGVVAGLLLRFFVLFSGLLVLASKHGDKLCQSVPF